MHIICLLRASALCTFIVEDRSLSKYVLKFPVFEQIWLVVVEFIFYFHRQFYNQDI